MGGQSPRCTLLTPGQCPLKKVKHVLQVRILPPSSTQLPTSPPGKNAPGISSGCFSGRMIEPHVTQGMREVGSFLKTEVTMSEYTALIRFKHGTKTKDVDDPWQFIAEAVDDRDIIKRIRLFRSSDLKEIIDLSSGDLNMAERVAEEL